MKTTVCKGRHVMGKLSRNGDKAAPRNCEAALTWELREENGRLEFSAQGEVWNHLKTDIVMGGQCVDELAARFPRDVLAQRIRRTWERYHLNGMNAGTPDQVVALRIAEAEALEVLRTPGTPDGCLYREGKINWHVAGDYLTGEKCGGYYGWACIVLKKAGLYEVPVTDELRASALGGLPADAKTYKYGSGWLHYAIPEEFVDLIKRGFQDVSGPGAVEHAADPAEAGDDDRDLIAEAGLTVVATFVPWSQSRNKGENSPSLNWRVTLQCKGRDVLTCDYSAGSGHCPAYGRKFNTPTVNPANEKRAAIRQECETGYATRGGMIAGQFTRGAKIEPAAKDVISSLLLDASILDAGSFADWAADMGMDADSIKARAIYDECIAHAVAFRAAVGPAMFNALVEGNA